MSVEDWEIRQVAPVGGNADQAIARVMGVAAIRCARRWLLIDVSYLRAARGWKVDAVEPQIREFAGLSATATVVAERIGWASMESRSQGPDS